MFVPIFEGEATQVRECRRWSLSEAANANDEIRADHRPHRVALAEDFDSPHKTVFAGMIQTRLRPPGVFRAAHQPHPSRHYREPDASRDSPHHRRFRGRTTITRDRSISECDAEVWTIRLYWSLSDILSAEERVNGVIWRVPLLALLLSVPGCSQQVADFSGVWRMDAARSESAHQAVPIGPVTLIIKSTGGELSIESRRANNGKRGVSTETLKFTLDGSETVVPDNSGAAIKTRAHLTGAKLITETARNIQGSTVTTVQTFSLHANGKEMIIDKTLTVQHGYQSTSADANNTGRGTDVFVRSNSRR